MRRSSTIVTLRHPIDTKRGRERRASKLGSYLRHVHRTRHRTGPDRGSAVPHPPAWAPEVCPGGQVDRDYRAGGVGVGAGCLCRGLPHGVRAGRQRLRHVAGDDRLLLRRRDRARPVLHREPRPGEPRADPRPCGAGGDRRRGPLLLRQPRRVPHGHHPRRLEQPDGGSPPGRLDDHPAVREELLPDPRPHAGAQGAGVLRRTQGRPAAGQGSHSRGLPQHHLLRARCLRNRDRGSGVLRHLRERAQRCAGGHPRRRPPLSRQLRPRRRAVQPRRARGPLPLRPRRHGPAGRHQPAARGAVAGAAPGAVPGGGPPRRHQRLPAQPGPKRAQRARLRRRRDRHRRPARRHDVRPAGPSRRRGRGAAGGADPRRPRRAPGHRRGSSRHWRAGGDVRRSRLRHRAAQLGHDRAPARLVVQGLHARGRAGERRLAARPLRWQLPAPAAGWRQGRERVPRRLRRVRRHRRGDREVDQHRLRRPHAPARARHRAGRRGAGRCAPGHTGAEAQRAHHPRHSRHIAGPDGRRVRHVRRPGCAGGLVLGERGTLGRRRAPVPRRAGGATGLHRRRHRRRDIRVAAGGPRRHRAGGAPPRPSGRRQDRYCRLATRQHHRLLVRRLHPTVGRGRDVRARRRR